MADIANVGQKDAQKIYDAVHLTKANILTRLLCTSPPEPSLSPLYV
jgi:hypothetical protein